MFAFQTMYLLEPAKNKVAAANDVIVFHFVIVPVVVSYNSCQVIIMIAEQRPLRVVKYNSTFFILVATFNLTYMKKLVDRQRWAIGLSRLGPCPGVQYFFKQIDKASRKF